MSEKIRVLQLGSPTGLYGAERWILALVRHLDPTKVESFVGVIKDAPDLECPLIHEAAALGMNTCIFESYGRISFTAVKQLREFIRKQKIDILHTHYYKTDLIGFLATKGTKCKSITTPHGWTQKPDFKLYIYEALDRCLFLFMDAVFPLTEDMAKPYKYIPIVRKNFFVINNGVDISEIDKESCIANELIKWNEEGYFVVGYIGRLIPGKGLDVLLHALAQQPTNLKWRLAIIGEGEDAPLTSLANTLKILKNINFFGYQERRISFLKGFDVFVLPSRSEGTPRCVMEAMAAGIPVIASNIKGCQMLISDNKTGLLFTVDTPKHLAEKIFFLATDTSIRKKLSGRGRLFIQQNFSAARMAQEYMVSYHKLLANNHTLWMKKNYRKY